MATSKRERQKAARREKLERQQRAERRRRTVRRGVIGVIVAALVIGTGFVLFGGSGKNPTTTTTAAPTTTTSSPAVTTTTIAVPTSFPKVVDPSPAGTFGKEPTVVVPPGKPPTTMEVSDLITGTGPAAKIGDTLTVQYVLATYSARKVVQASWTTPSIAKTGFSFTLSTASVIPGWVYGVAGMRVGGRRELIIPPSPYGYRNTSPGPGIAKNDTLVFIVDLLKIG